MDSLVAPDSNTALYTAVECYDPWSDTWRFAIFFFCVLQLFCFQDDTENVADISPLRKRSFSYLLNVISALGLSPRCRSLTSSLPFLCPMMCPLPLASGTVFMCLGASEGPERNCYFSTIQGKVRQSSKKTRHALHSNFNTRNGASVFSLSIRLLVRVTSHSYQRRCRPSCPLLPGSH